MAISLEDSLGSTLEYDAEVAYISATSPVAREEKRKSNKINEQQDFDFAVESSPEKNSALPEIVMTTPEAKTNDKKQGSPDKDNNKEGDSEEGKEAVNLILMSDPKKKESGKQSKQHKGSHLAPLLPPPHYILDIASTIPGTPTSKLRLIKEAQTSPPSPKLTSPKLKVDGTHNYKILVIYGSSGCGRTHLVQKLVHSNPAVFAMVISTTTRRQRANEVDGVDFHFVMHKDMSKRIARGDFIEYVQINRHKKDEKKRRKTVVNKAEQPGKDSPLTAKQHRIMLSDQRRATLAQLPTGSEQLVAGHRFESLFDLTEDDSPVLGGEVFGTSHQSLIEATQQGKPCVVMNVSTKGAQQLKKAGIQAAYVCVHTGLSPQQGAAQGVMYDHSICVDNLERAYTELNQYAFELIRDLNLAQSTKYEIAKHEWDSLPTVQFESKQSVPQKKVRPVTFSEVFTHFQNADMKRKLGETKLEQPKLGLSSLFGRTKLAKKLQHEKMLVLAIAHCPLNDKDRLHLRTLQTIYSKLTGSSLNCRRFGNHWQDIGFNGIDPADDLQGVGFLGLIQLVYFLDDPRTMPIAQEIFRYCQQESHRIPFCVLSINFTQMSLSALRDGVLNKMCNKRDQVFVVVNEFYMAVFYHYYQQWKLHHKSILELGPLLKDIGEFAKINLKEIVHAFEVLLSQRGSRSTPELTSLQTAENPFTPLDKITDV